MADSEIWITAFYDPIRSRKKWYTPLLKKGFKHCIAWRDNGDNVIIVDPNRSNLGVFTVTHKVFVRYRTYFSRQKAVCVAFKTAENDVKVPLIYTCASVLGRLYGLNGFIVRPYGLYRALLASGGVSFSIENKE